MDVFNLNYTFLRPPRLRVIFFRGIMSTYFEKAATLFHKATTGAITLAVITTAMGFFVDAYGLLLYSIVRNQNLLSIGISGNAPLTTGIDLLNTQLIGMLAGGILWGVLGSAATIGAAVIAIALIALGRLEETYGKDLDFVES